MSPVRYRFQLSDSVPLEEAELTLQLSIFAVEGIYGEARVRLDARYDVDGAGRALVVDASTEVGESLVRVFARLLTREFGDGGFTVRRGRGSAPAAAESTESQARTVAAA